MQMRVDMIRGYKSSKTAGINVNVKQILVGIIVPIFAANIRSVPPAS